MIKVGEFHYEPEELTGLFVVPHYDNQNSGGRYITSSPTGDEEITEVYSFPVRDSEFYGSPPKLIGKFEYSPPGYYNIEDLTTVQDTIEAYEHTGSGPGDDSGKGLVATWVDTGTNCYTVYAASKSQTQEILKELAILELRSFGYVKNGFAPSKLPQTWNPGLRWTPKKKGRTRQRKS